VTTGVLSRILLYEGRSLHRVPKSEAI
jgi:hypothetical protein